MWNIKLKTIADDSNPNNGKYFKEFVDGSPVYSDKSEAFTIDYNGFNTLSTLNSEFNNGGMNIHTIEQA